MSCRERIGVLTDNIREAIQALLYHFTNLFCRPVFRNAFEQGEDNIYMLDKEHLIGMHDPAEVIIY